MEDHGHRPSFDELMMLGDPRHSGTFAAGVDLEALAEWEWSVNTRVDMTSFEDQPERLSLSELLPAWRGGLRTVTEIPFAQRWARRIGSAHLLVATRTRHDREAYARALSLPVEPRR